MRTLEMKVNVKHVHHASVVWQVMYILVKFKSYELKLNQINIHQYLIMMNRFELFLAHWGCQQMSF